MGFQISPSVTVTERDLTTVVRGVSTTIGAYVGPFAWGPANEIVKLGSERDLTRLFAGPIPILKDTGDGVVTSNVISWFLAKNFLLYGDNLNLVRVVETENTGGKITALNAGADGSDATAAIGTVTLDTGAGGSVDSILVDSVEMLTGAIPFNTSLAQTATDVASDITGNATVPNYTAIAVGAVITITADTLGIGVNGLVVLSTATTITTSDVNMAGGTDADTNALLLENSSDFDNVAGTAVNEYWLAKWAGALGNSLRFSIADYASFENYNITGTGSVANITDQLVGVGTLFLEELYVGAKITLDSTLVTILSIQSDTLATLTADVSPALASGTMNLDKWRYHDLFDGIPGTSSFALGKGGLNDECHFAIIDQNGEHTGIAGTVLETLPYLSKATDAKTGDGTSNYFVKKINNSSLYAWALQDVFAFLATLPVADGTTDFTPYALTTPLVKDLFGGQDGTAPDSGDILGTSGKGWDLFADAETSGDVNLLICPPLYSSADLPIPQGLISLVENRKDAVVFISPNFDDVPPGGSSNALASVLAFADELNVSSSYAFVTNNWKFQYDKYNDQFIWVPDCGDMAGLAARTDETNDPWFSFAGFNRGNLLEVNKLAWNPIKAERDELYKKSVNSVVTLSGSGTILFGDRTFLDRPSAFQAVNVRRLFIVLEKAIATAAKFSLFEFNDAFTRASFIQLVTPFLRDVQGRRGVISFRVDCDEENNTDQVIAAQEFVADIYIQPALSINFIRLNFIATRTGANFEELV